MGVGLLVEVVGAVGDVGAVGAVGAVAVAFALAFALLVSVDCQI